MLKESDDAQYFGIEPLKRQEHNRKVCCVRWHDVFVTDILSALLDTHFQLLGVGCYLVRVCLLVGLKQSLVILNRELRVDRQPNHIFVFTRHFDCEFNPVIGARLNGHILFVLLGGQDFF